MDQLNVIASPLPFSNKQVSVEVAPGSTVQQIVAEVVRPEIENAGITAFVSVNGSHIPQSYWGMVKPKVGTNINVKIVPRGGGGGKNPLATLLSIAVAVAVPFAAPAFGGAVFGAAGIGYTTGIALANVTLGLIGGLIVNALAPPPSQGGSSVNNPAESPTSFIEGASNSFSPFGTVPVCLGTNRMFPPQAARVYTETVDDEQYSRQLFTYGFGSEVQISDLKIGETSLSEFDDFEIEHKLEGDLHEGTSLYTNDVFQEDHNVLISEEGGAITRTTQFNTDEALVDITFPQGLSEIDSQGERLQRAVTFELQYAESGVSPQEWSPALGAFNSIASQSFAVEPIAVNRGFNASPIEIISGVPHYFSERLDIVSIDRYSGVGILRKGSPMTITGSVTIPATAPIPSATQHLLATIKVRSYSAVVTSAEFTRIESISDDRDPNLFGLEFSTSSDFAVTNSGINVDVAAGLLGVDQLRLNEATNEPLRRSFRLVFPSRAQYDIRIRRSTPDLDPEEDGADRIFDEGFLTAVRSITFRPPVNLAGVNGTALRIKGTDQLNGTVDQFNVVCSNVILDYDSVLDDWVPRATSNPASIYRYVLQQGGNPTPVPDDEIDFETLQSWHTHCEEQGYTYNRIIDSEVSVEQIAQEVASAGSATPAFVDGLRSVAIDRIKEDIKQVVTARNSWNYSGELVYPSLPHALRVQFRNAAEGYAADELIVYDDGFDEETATIFESLDLNSCTSAALAFQTARRFLAQGRLRPEVYQFSMDAEHLVALRGDRMKFVNDVPLIGVGDGRIKSVELNGESPAQVIGVELDDVVGIPSAGTYFMRIRKADGQQIYQEIFATVGSFASFQFREPLDIAPEVGDLCYVVEAGQEKDIIITQIDMSDDLSAAITAIDYAPEVFEAEDAPIPLFESNVTIPLELQRPNPPRLIEALSDESVMVFNSDGSLTSRAVFSLSNDNEGQTDVFIKVRLAGTQTFRTPTLLEASSEKVSITGLNDGLRYDIRIRYRRAGAQLFSAPLELNNYLFVGASTLPTDVQGFAINVSGDTALFKWDANNDVDLAGYRMKSSGAYEGATWETAQILEDLVETNRITLPFQGGTYLVKAVDRSGNESENAALVITFNPGNQRNVVKEIIEDDSYLGQKDNVGIVEGSLVLDNPSLDGFYYFDDDLDLGGVYTSTLAATIVSGGTVVNDLFDHADLFEPENLYDSGDGNLFAFDDLFATDDLFGLETGTWTIQLQYRVSQQGLADSGIQWSPWLEFAAGAVEFRSVQFRLLLQSVDGRVSPSIDTLRVLIDMPDRIVRGEDLIVPAPGAVVSYDPPFNATPSVQITLQDASAEDRVEFTSKTSSGFAFKVYNEGTASYVERSYDYIASGFGRQN